MAIEIASAIKSDELSELSISMIDIADNISSIFEEIDKKVNELNEYLQCDALSKIIEEYELLKENYKIIHSNVITYSDDLIDVNNNMQTGMKEIKFDFQRETAEFQSKNKGVKDIC